MQYLNRIGRRVITTMIVDAGEHLEFAQPLSATASLPRDIEVEARADAALIKEADGRAIPINALKLSRTTRVIMPGATYCAELRRCCEKR